MSASRVMSTFKHQSKIIIMKRIILTAVLLSLISSCSKETITGSGNLISEERDVAAFTRISSEGIIDVELTQGDAQFIEITADDNIIDRVRTQVVNGELRVFLEGDSYRDIQINARITATGLSGISNSGTGSITASSLSGSETFALYNSGTGNVTISGSANSLDLVNEGSGDIRAFGFEVSQADLTLIGSGNAEVYCTNALTVLIEGSGSVYYKGNPTIETSIEGSGKVLDAN